MSAFAKDTKATVIPVLRYRDAPAAIEWLCRTFGFEKNLVVPGDGGTIAHAQLSFGNGMIMLGSVLEQASEFGGLMKQPDEIGGAETQCASDQGRGLRRPRLQLLRPGRPPLELRHL